MFVRSEADFKELERQRDDLAMLVRMLSHKVRNLSPDSSLADRAMSYLCSKGLQGCITRLLEDSPDSTRRD